MGWRERDWAKFTDEERAALFGGGGGSSFPPSAEGAGHRLQPLPPMRKRRGVSRRRHGIGKAVLIGVGVITVVVFAYDHLGRSNGTGSLRSLRPGLPFVTPPARVKTVVIQHPANVITIHWRASDLSPAPEAGTICVTDARKGRICASYVIGERPADTLTREIEARGLRVESSGSG